MTIRAATCVLACVLAAGVAAAAEAPPEGEILALLGSERPRDRAIRNALAWLRSRQTPDGAFGEKEKHAAALTSLALMAHLAAGHTPEDPEHGERLRAGLRYVLSMQSDNGYFGEKDGSRMYGHGMATLLLAEVLGMCGDFELDEAVRLALERALAVTVNAALVDKPPPHAGGWRYQPHDTVSDLSLSGWQLMSLHAAQQVGIAVPEEVVVRACAYARQLVGPQGQVGYHSVGEDRPALRGLALLCFAIGRSEDDSLVDRVQERILQDPLRWQGPWFFYRAYYDAVGISRVRPEAWDSYRHRLESVLVEHQHADGYWPSPPGDNEGGHGRIYCTSMAVMALAVERHVLPAYQR